MELELGNFYAKGIVFGNRTRYENSVLTVDKEGCLAFVKRDPYITGTGLRIVRSSDMVRLVPVKEAVERRIKVSGGALFLGYTGPLSQTEDGGTYCLKDIGFLVARSHWGGFWDGLIDMGGGDAKYTYFSKFKNPVLIADTDEELEKREQQRKNRAIKEATHKLAEYVNSHVRDTEPGEVRSYELEPVIRRAPETKKLPSIVYMMQPQSQMGEMGYNDLCYRWNCNHMLSTFTNPNGALGKTMISGSFMLCSSKWTIYDLQNCPVIKRLYKEHGRTLNFLGVIMSGLNVILEQKECSTLSVAQVTKPLEASAVLAAEKGYGNPNADLTGCTAALEKAGVRTVGLTNEYTGRDGKPDPLAPMDEKEDATISIDNVSELVEPPPISEVIGELEALARDDLPGDWAGDEVLGPSVRPGGSITVENNTTFCGDQITGWSTKTVKEF